MGKALIGAQLYTLRDFCKTPAEIASSCARVKAMGYDGVQVSGVGAIEPAELRRILAGEGLACAATHISLEQMENETAKVIEEHRLWGCTYTAIGGFFPSAAWTLGLWQDFVRRFNAVAHKFKGSGVSIGYHNHSHELAPADGVRPMDLLIQALDPASVWMEIDTYWIAHGGADPAAYIDKVAGRIPCVHFKDMTITSRREQKMTEIGDGNLNWPRIIQACRKAGVEWYLVERDSGDLDPFDSLQRSVENMRGPLGL
jgi:sugar phosphate isomerase/epimerase